MAASDPRNVVRIAGTLTFGGVAIGVTKDARFLPNVRTRDVTAEEWGGMTTETIYAGESPIIMGVLRSWDNQAVGAIFPQGTVGSSTVRANVRSGKLRPGAVLSEEKGDILRIVPRDAVNDPGVVLYRAVPVLRDAAEIQAMIGEDLGIGFVFRATPDSRSRIYDIGVGV